MTVTLRNSRHLADRLHLGGSAGIRNIVRDADHDAREAATRSIIGQTWNLQSMLSAGCTKAEVLDCVDSALNAFALLDGRLHRALAEVGLVDEHIPLDLSGLEALKAELEGGK